MRVVNYFIWSEHKEAARVAAVHAHCDASLSHLSLENGAA